MAEFENPFADPEAQNLFHVSPAVLSCDNWHWHLCRLTVLFCCDVIRLFHHYYVLCFNVHIFSD